MIDLNTILGWPVSRPGKWAMVLALAFLGLMLAFYGFIQSGQQGGSTFFSNPLLAIILLAAGACGISSGFVAAYAIGTRKERAVALYVAVFMGFFVLTFVVGELIGHE